MDSPTAGFDHYPLHYRSYYLNVGEFRGQPLVHIRERLDNGAYTRRGIALYEEDWGDLVALTEHVLAALRDLVTQPPNAEDTWAHTIGHRGRRVVVSKYRGAGYVNIRNWWAPRPGENARPTRIGVKLSQGPFNHLLEYEMFVNDDLNRLVVATEARRAEQTTFERRLEERREAIALRAAAAVREAMRRPAATASAAVGPAAVAPAAAAASVSDGGPPNKVPLPEEFQHLEEFRICCCPRPLRGCGWRHDQWSTPNQAPVSTTMTPNPHRALAPPPQHSQRRYR